eukprot:694218-Pleurochrysis_carterae.AAC.1
MLLVGSGGLRGYPSGTDGWRSNGGPREACLVKIDVRGDDNAQPGNEGLVCPRGLRAQAKVDTDPGT